jgi:uncharacterized SAM-binding protein YcdF (DUF218 family)
MLFFSDPAQTVLPSVVYLTVLLLVLVVIAFRSASRSFLYRFRYVLVALFLWTYVTSTPLFSNLLVLNLERQYPVARVEKDDRSPDNLIVVLTSGRVRSNIEGDHPYLDEAGWNRALSAIELWRQIGGKLLFNGGPVAGDGYSVADRMAELARATGVPNSVIAVDGRARNTHENLLNTASKINRKQQRVWLVTSAMHLPRTMAVANRLGVSATAVPCDFRGNTKLGWRGWLPNHNGSRDFERALHELLGMFYYRLRGWI